MEESEAPPSACPIRKEANPTLPSEAVVINPAAVLKDSLMNSLLSIEPLLS